MNVEKKTDMKKRNLGKNNSGNETRKILKSELGKANLKSMTKLEMKPVVAKAMKLKSDIWRI